MMQLGEELHSLAVAPADSPCVWPARAEPGMADAVVRWAFYAFVFSLLFEMGKDRELPFEIPTVLSSLLIVVALLKPRTYFRQPPLALCWFALYLWVFLISLVVHGPGTAPLVGTRLVWLVQLLLQFWVTYNLMRDDRVARGALLTYVAACGVLAALQLSGLLDATANPRLATRATVMGQNPSNLAGLLSLGLLMMVGLSCGAKQREQRAQKSLLLRLLAWPLFALLGALTISTGGRGPLLALGAGMLAFAFRHGGLWSKVKRGLLILLGIGFLGYFAYQSDAVRGRFERSFMSGNLAGREKLFPAAWQMFQDQPLLGWGPVNKNFEIQRRAQLPGNIESRDPHNLFLEVLTATGLLGAIPFFAGIWLCALAAWKSRLGPYGVLPFALLVTALLVNLSVNWFYCKAYWLVLAFALASGHATVAARSVHFRKTWRPQLNGPSPALAAGETELCPPGRAERLSSLFSGARKVVR